MDIGYFLKKRTAFIRYVYSNGARPFCDVEQRIETGAPPYDSPPYSEDGEPPYMAEWQEATAGRAVLGLTCISLLSDTLKLYFETLRRRVIGFKRPEEQLFKKYGFVSVYRTALGSILETNWSDCPANFGVIEQVVLARNRSQHGEDFTSFDVTHDREMLRKYPAPFFVSEQEYQIWAESGGEPMSFLAPRIAVSAEALFAAIEHIEKLSDYIESRLDRVTAWRMRAHDT